MNRAILGAVFAVLAGHVWAESVLVTGFYPNLSTEAAKDVCSIHALLARSYMELRLEGKQKDELLEDHRRKKGVFWDVLGVPEGFHDVNEKLLKAIYATRPLKDMSQKDELLNLVNQQVFELCLGQKSVDAPESKPSEMYPNDSDYRLGNAHDCNRVSSYALDVMKKRQEQGGLLSDKLPALYKGADEGATIWWGIVIRLTIEAYKMPQWSDEATRLYMADQFANMAMAKCLG